jgi:hypothetical protein
VNREIASEIDQHAALPNVAFAAERKKPRPLKSKVICKSLNLSGTEK